MLQTRSMAPSLIYMVSFSLCKIIQISVCQNEAVQAMPNIQLGRTSNDHAQKCRCLCNHSPTSIKAGDMIIFLTVILFDMNDYKSNGISGPDHYVFCSSVMLGTACTA